MNYSDLTQQEKNILNSMIPFMLMDDRFDIEWVFKKGVIECKLKIEEQIPIADKLCSFLTKQNFIGNPGLAKLTEKGKQLKLCGSFDKYYEKINNENENEKRQENMKEQVAKRDTLLLTIFDVTKGDLNTWVDIRLLAQNKNLYDTYFDSNFRWLLEKGLIKRVGLGTPVLLTSNGRDYIENKLLPNVSNENYSIYQQPINEKYEHHIHINAPITNSNVNQLLGSFEGNKDLNIANTIKQNDTTPITPPIVKPDGWLKKFRIFISNNIGKILISLISGIILLWLKFHYFNG